MCEFKKKSRICEQQAMNKSFLSFCDCLFLNCCSAFLSSKIPSAHQEEFSDLLDGISLYYIDGLH